MTLDIPELIAIASTMYALQAGDVILTGTPEGVGAVAPGDVIRAECSGIGEMSVRVMQHPGSLT
ncbi:fumarylacetoacetate hydrolase family protein [Cupriavidus basilensis]